MIKRLWPAGLILALLLVVSFGVAAPPERCPSVTPVQLTRSAQAGVDWFVRNQNADGTWLYLYKRDDTAPSDYNVVRHTGAAMGLYLAAHHGLPRALRSADRGTRWALARLLQRDDWSAVEYNGQVPTGATALLTAGLVLRRETTNDPRYDAVLHRLGRFLAAQTERSGAVLAAYDPIRGTPVAGEHSKYFTGEAYWALTLLHRTFPREQWGRLADRIGAYLATSRDDAEDHWPPIADHWAAYGLSETVRERRLSGDEAAYARDQAELFGFSVRWISARFAPWGAVLPGRQELRGGGYGVISEALTGLWLAARDDPRLADVRAAIGRRAMCNAGLAVKAQSSSGATQVKGAWFRDGETRMDDQQHALAGLLRTVPIAQAQARSEPGPGSTPPSAWLWIAVLLLALNPVRAAFATSRDGLRPAGLGALGVCAAALVADPLLDVLDVSAPSFRIAAGVVAVLAGAADLLRRPPSAQSAVPRPALVVLALGAGADRSALVTVAAMALGVALLAGLTLRRPADDRALGWAGRLLGAGLVACGVLLAIDGIFDV